MYISLTFFFFFLNQTSAVTCVGCSGGVSSAQCDSDRCRDPKSLPHVCVGQRNQQHHAETEKDALSHGREVNTTSRMFLLYPSILSLFCPLK